MKTNFVDTSKVYDANIESPDIRGKEELRPWNLFKIIKSHVTSQSKLLDVGCGTANKSIPLAPYVKNLTGLDIWKNPKLAQKAALNVKESHYKNIVLKQGDSRRLPFADNSFDLLTYMLAPQYAYETYRVLKPMGFVIIERVGEQDKLNFKKMFGNNENGRSRGQNCEFEYGDLAGEYVRELIRVGFCDVKVCSGKWKTWYSREGLLKLFQATPTVQSFDLQKDAPIIENIVQKYRTNHGILTLQHRYLIIAQKT